MPAGILKITIVAALALTMQTATVAQAAERGNAAGVSSTPLHQRLMAARHKAARIVSFKMKCAVFSLSGANSRHVVVWRTNGVPVPAGTKIKLKVLNHSEQSVLPAIAQGAKHAIKNALSAPVPHSSACQAKVI